MSDATALANPNEEIDLQQIADEVGVSRRTVSNWASPTKRFGKKRLKVIRYSRQTVRVKRSVWQQFKEDNSL